MSNTAKLGSRTDHGGTIIKVAAQKTTGQGTPVAALGDLHSCPIRGHGVTPITSASGDSSVEGNQVARVGDKCGCGATIIDGFDTISGN